MDFGLYEDPSETRRKARANKKKGGGKPLGGKIIKMQSGSARDGAAGAFGVPAGVEDNDKSTQPSPTNGMMPKANAAFGNDGFGD